MDNKTQIHQNIMAFLDNYLKQTPKSIIKEEIQAISKINAEGVSAQEYFLNFDKYYLGLKVPVKKCKLQWKNAFGKHLIYREYNQPDTELCNIRVGVNITSTQLANT